MLSKQKLKILIISLIFWFFSGQVNAQQETVLQEIKRTGLLKVGVRENATPFGYRDVNNNLAGLCLDFIELLRDGISKEINREIIAIRIYTSNLNNRFELVSDKVVHLECGPNTIEQRLERENIQFSAPFFITGTQFLIKQENLDKILLNSDFNNLTIGVLRNTTNQALLLSRYPLANLVEFQGRLGRRRGLQALQSGKIDAFASDGILLLGEAILQGLSLQRDYELIPEQPLNCNYYGLILPKNDPQWRNLVDSVIQTVEAQGLLSQWFNLVFSYVQETRNYCQNSNQDIDSSK